MWLGDLLGTVDGREQTWFSVLVTDALALFEELPRTTLACQKASVIAENIKISSITVVNYLHQVIYNGHAARRKPYDAIWTYFQMSKQWLSDDSQKAF